MSKSTVMQQAESLASTFLTLDSNQKQKELQTLKQNNKLLYALVRFHLDKLRAASQQDSKQNNVTAVNKTAKELPVATDSKTDNTASRINYESSGKLKSLDISGMDYEQNMAQGTLCLHEVHGQLEDLKEFKAAFGVLNNTNSIIVQHSDKTKTVFSPPLSISSIFYESKADDNGVAQLSKVSMKFVREVVTIKPSKRG